MRCALILTVIDDTEVFMTFESLSRGIPQEMLAAFESILPPVVWQGNGRPPIANALCLHAAVFILISGTPWRQMPAGFPCGRTVRNRFKHWLDNDAFVKVWTGCVRTYQDQRGINFDQISIDGARKPAKKGDLRQALIPPIVANAALRL
jgi:transposase